VVAGAFSDALSEHDNICIGAWDYHTSPRDDDQHQEAATLS